MKRAWFFVHIPKTGGTSFRATLQETGRVNCLNDYGVGNPDSSLSLVSESPLALSRDSTLFHSDKLNVLCGHVNYKRYAHCFTHSDVISIMRNPVERLVSEYQHLRREEKYNNSFREFSASQVQQNKQLKMLKGIRNSKRAVIGLTSHYGLFLKIVSLRLDIPLNVQVYNTAPKEDSDARLRVAPAEIKNAYKCNSEELCFFFRRARLFSKLVEQVGYSIVPKSRTRWSCRVVNNSRVLGWVSRDKQECFFVVISADKARRVIIAANQPREDVYEKGLSEESECGFSFPLALLGVEKGDPLRVSILGAADMRKILIA